MRGGVWADWVLKWEGWEYTRPIRGIFFQKRWGEGLELPIAPLVDFTVGISIFCYQLKYLVRQGLPSSRSTTTTDVGQAKTLQFKN